MDLLTCPQASSATSLSLGKKRLPFFAFPVRSFRSWMSWISGTSLSLSTSARLGGESFHCCSLSIELCGTLRLCSDHCLQSPPLPRLVRARLARQEQPPLSRSCLRSTPAASSAVSEAMDHSFDSSEFWPRCTSLGRGASSSSTRSLERRQIQDSSRCYEGTRAQQNRNCVAATCQIGTHEWL